MAAAAGFLTGERFNLVGGLPRDGGERAAEEGNGGVCAPGQVREISAVDLGRGVLRGARPPARLLLESIPPFPPLPKSQRTEGAEGG